MGLFLEHQYLSSFAANPEPHPRPKIDSQGWVSDHFLVVMIEGILNVYINRYPRGEGVPASEIGPSVSGGMIDIET